MSDKSAIQWTEATWNPTTGCTKISPACAHCYIERTPPFRIAGRKFVKGHIPLQLHADRMEIPYEWKTPRMIFVNSLSDLFHPDVPFEFIAEVFTTMAQTTRHTYQVLTKRPERLLAFYRWMYGGLSWMNRAAAKADWLANWSHVWFGVSAENRYQWLQRVPTLLRVPAAIHWVSIEPCLEEMVDEVFTICLCSPWSAPPYVDKIDWLVVGGESGPGARPLHLEWVSSIVAAGRQYDAQTFVKQLGANAVTTNVNLYDFPSRVQFDAWGDYAASARVRFRDKKGGDPSEWPPDLNVRQFPKGVLIESHA